MSSRRVALIALVLAVVLVGGFFGYRYWTRSPHADPELSAALRALSSPDAFALLRVDVGELAQLDGGGRDLLESLAGPLGRVTLAALDWRSEVRQALAAFYAPGGGEWQLAAVLLGSFDPSALESRLSSRAELRVEEARTAGMRVLLVGPRDPDRCELAAEWALQLARDRILVGHPAAVERVLAREAAPASPTREPSPLQVSARGLLSLSFLAAPASGPEAPEWLRAALTATSAELGALRSASIHLKRGRLGRGLTLEVELPLASANEASTSAAHWLELRDRLRPEWTLAAPALTALHDALEIEAGESVLRGRAAISSETLGRSARLPDEALVLISRVLAGAVPDQVTIAVDDVDPRPREFRARVWLDSLPLYDAERPLAGPADAVSGPFGIRTRNVRTSADAMGLAVELEAVGPALPNRSERGSEAQLRLTSVEGEDGRELLREEPCGPDRNGRPVPLALDFSGDWMSARKTVRLVPGATLDEIEEVAGEVILQLPTAVERARLDPPEPGGMAVSDGVRVELTSVSPHSFSYRIAGDVTRVLEVRGLNHLARPLAANRAWDANLWLADGRVGARDYRGDLASVEVVFALERDEQVHAFSLPSARPGSDVDEYSAESARFIEYSAAQYEKEFGPLIGRSFEPDHPVRALTTAGPFTLALRDTVDLPLQVLAPDIPNLSYNLGGLELAIDRIGIRAGALSSELPLRVALAPRRSFGRDELLSSIDLAPEAVSRESDIARIEGQLVLRLPRTVHTEAVPAVEPGRRASAEGLTFELVELARDRFTALLSGRLDALISVQAFSSEGEELRVERIEAASAPSGALWTFHVYGQPARMALQVARDSARLNYAFRLDVPPELPAAPESD